MEPSKFERLKSKLSKELSAEQWVDIEALARSIAKQSVAETAIAKRTKHVSDTNVCPHCGKKGIVRNGLDKAGIQRFLCRASECGKGFNALTGTPLARMRKPEKWAEFAGQLGRFVSCEKLAEIGISKSTCWRWRNRLLASQIPKQTAVLDGIIEIDEKFFRTSYKGSRGWVNGKPPEPRTPRYRGSSALKPGISAEQVPVLTALDRHGGQFERVLAKRTEIRGALSGRIGPQAVMCTDGLVQYDQVADDADAEHRIIKTPKLTWLQKIIGGKPRKPGKLGLGRVNAHHERMETFINRALRGVSTKHLPSYIAWLKAMRTEGFLPENLIIEALIPIK